MRRSLRTPTGRLLVATATVAMAAVVLVDIATAEAGDGIEATGASVDKVGWWHQRNEAIDGPLGNVTIPSPPGVPAGTLAVGAVNGESDKVTAIGILPDALTGDTITAFTLTMKEAGPPAANVNSAEAKIVACPITSFWVGGENGTWKSQPLSDCGLAKAPAPAPPTGPGPLTSSRSVGPGSTPPAPSPRTASSSWRTSQVPRGSRPCSPPMATRPSW